MADHQTCSVYTSMRYLAARWCWGLATVDRYIKELEATRQVTKKYVERIAEHLPEHLQALAAERGLTQLTIVNFNEYQDPSQLGGTPAEANSGTQSGTQSGTISIHNNQLNMSDPKEVKSSTSTWGKNRPDRIDPTSVRLATMLRREVLSLNGNNIVPSLEHTKYKHKGWAHKIDLMVRIDKRPVGEIEETIEWLFSENLARRYSFVVLSAQALREKWDRIQVQRRGHQARPPPRRKSIKCARCQQGEVQKHGGTCLKCKYEIESRQADTPAAREAARLALAELKKQAKMG
jgi:hypothetical protein